MSSLIRWYLGTLKTHPLKANIGSAFVLMAAGDVAAQRIEIGHLHEDDKESSHSAPVKRLEQQEDHMIHFRHYGTLTPDVEKIQHEIHEHEHHALSLSNWHESAQEFLDDARKEIASLDLFRTGTMAFWAAAFYSPFWIGVFKLFDRFLPPVGAPRSIASRVGLQFVASVPLNAAFFCYGSFVHHLVEWAVLVQDYRVTHALPIADCVQKVPFKFGHFWTAARLKLQTELASTMMVVGLVWVPINHFNFSVMPPHLRPLTIMVCSAGWNCYLSLAQHRDVIHEE